MNRNPSGDWSLPGGALAFVLVLLALSIAADALGGVTYVDPAGWTLVVDHVKTEAELQDFRDSDATYRRLVPRMLRKFNLAREIATTEGTYVECWIDVPDGVEPPSFTPADGWVATNGDSTTVNAIRMLFTESARHNMFVYDTSERYVSLARGSLKLSRDDEQRVFAILHFPKNLTDERRLTELVFRRGPRGGDLFSCED